MLLSVDFFKIILHMKHKIGKRKARLYLLWQAFGQYSIGFPVHEMARDEARHGKAFEGLLKRYF